MTAEIIAEKCKEIRKQVFIQAYHGGGAHMGAAFSVADILGTLYFGDVLRYQPDYPDWEDRDKVILSKGHAGGVICYPGFGRLFWQGTSENLLSDGK